MRGSSFYILTVGLITRQLRDNCKRKFYRSLISEWHQPVRIVVRELWERLLSQNQVLHLHKFKQHMMRIPKQLREGPQHAQSRRGTCPSASTAPRSSGSSISTGGWGGDVGSQPETQALLYDGSLFAHMLHAWLADSCRRVWSL